MTARIHNIDIRLYLPHIFMMCDIDMCKHQKTFSYCKMVPPLYTPATNAMASRSADNLKKQKPFDNIS